MRLFSAGNIARKKDYTRGLQPGEQGTEPKRHFSAVKADDEQLADLSGN